MKLSNVRAPEWGKFQRRLLLERESKKSGGFKRLFFATTADRKCIAEAVRVALVLLYPKDVF